MILKHLAEIWTDLRALAGMTLLSWAIEVLPNTPLRKHVATAIVTSEEEELDAIVRKVM